MNSLERSKCPSKRSYAVERSATDMDQEGVGLRGGMEGRTCVGVEGEEGADRAASAWGGRGDEIGYIYL